MKARKSNLSHAPLSDEPIVFGRVVAQRQYRVGRETIVLQIGTPHVTSWKTDFYCPIRLVRAGKAQVHRVFGVDSVQALMLAFDLAKAVLETTSHKITWSAGERPGDVGIDRRLSSGLGVDFGRHLERLVDRAILRRSRELERLHRGKSGPSRAGRRKPSK